MTDTLALVRAADSTRPWSRLCRAFARFPARAALTHTGDFLLIEKLELLVDVFEVPLDLGEEYILDGSCAALSAHVFPHQPPEVQRAHCTNHQRLEQRAIVPGTIARFGRGADGLLRGVRRDRVLLSLEDLQTEEPGAGKLELALSGGEGRINR